MCVMCGSKEMMRKVANLYNRFYSEIKRNEMNVRDSEHFEQMVIIRTDQQITAREALEKFTLQE